MVRARSSCLHSDRRTAGLVRSIVPWPAKTRSMTEAGGGGRGGATMAWPKPPLDIIGLAPYRMIMEFVEMGAAARPPAVRDRADLGDSALRMRRLLHMIATKIL